MLTDGDLTVRHPLVGDAEAVAANVRASVPELEPWMPWASADYSVADALDWIEGRLGDAYSFLLIGANGELVGTCGLNELDELNQRANLGYWVRSDQTGNGYATRATKLVARFGLEVVQLERLEIVVSVLNEQSRAVAERAGATYEGVARHRLLRSGVSQDAHIFSFVAGDDV